MPWVRLLAVRTALRCPSRKIRGLWVVLGLRSVECSPIATTGLLSDGPLRSNSMSDSVEGALADSSGPFFEDLTVGRVFEEAAPTPVTDALALLYRGITGDSLRLTLDSALCQRVTGSRHPLASPGLVSNVAVSASTVATRNVMANLFYRDVHLLRPVFIGDSLRTTTRVLAAQGSSGRMGRPPAGKVLLGVRTVNQHGEPVVELTRCALVRAHRHAAPSNGPPLVDADAEAQTDLSAFAVPRWDLSPLACGTLPQQGVELGPVVRDSVSDARLLVRILGNVAAAHRDAAQGQSGRRLVYGGHTFGMAEAALVQLVPSLVTVLGWLSCDHPAPVFEDDVLSVSTRQLDSIDCDGGAVASYEVAARASEGEEGSVGRIVLIWRPVLLLAVTLN